MREKLQPTVTYLQKLGEEYIDQIFKYARWVFQQDQNIALEVRLKGPLVPEIAQTLPWPLGRSSNLRMSSSLDPRLRTFSKPSTREFAPGSLSTLSKRKGKTLSLSITDLQSYTSRWRLLVGARSLKVSQPRGDPASTDSRCSLATRGVRQVVDFYRYNGDLSNRSTVWASAI